jgi:predicted Zn-dependent protease
MASRNRHPQAFVAALLLLLITAAPSCISTNLAPLQKAGAPLEDDERRIWTRAGEEEALLDKSDLIVHDTALTIYINRVASRIERYLPAQGILEVRVRVIRNPLLNAFTYPDGSIYVHSGILAKMENEAQLATLLGHEVTHATHRHTARSYRQIKNAAGLYGIFTVATWPFGIYGYVASLLGEIGTYASISGYSQDMEREADKAGLALMVSAGYNPYEAPKLFEQIRRDLEEEDIDEPFFFGTHPRIRERLENYARFLKAAHYDTAGRIGSEEFTARVMPLVLDNTEMDLSLGRYAAALRGVTRSLAADSLDARAHYLLGEIYDKREKERDTLKAEEEFTRAAALDSGLAAAQKALGLLHMKQKKHDAARKELGRYLLLAPGASDRQYIEQYLRTLQ